MTTTYTAIVHRTADGQFYELEIERTAKSDVLFTAAKTTDLRTGFFMQDVAGKVEIIFGKAMQFDTLTNSYSQPVTAGQFLQLKALFY
jgi:hypothetical protein